MQGLLADENVSGELAQLGRILEGLDLSPILAGLNLRLATFADAKLPQGINDRELWNWCQESGWILFTDNRNLDTLDSLEAALRELWRPGHLPVITLSSKPSFQQDRGYAERVAIDVAEILFDMATEARERDEPRIYVPR